jgi:hypothetical protein
MRSLAPIVLVFALACGGRKSQRPALPSLVPPSRVDNTLVFELPDSGGYVVNGVPIEADRIDTVVGEAFAGRAPLQRAVVVWDNPHRPWADLQPIIVAARARGGEAYDAARSGWSRIREQLPPP